MTGKFEAISFWPRAKLDLGNEHNTTTSEHLVSIDALKHFDLLKEGGYGGEGKIFPTKGFIRPVKEESELDMYLDGINLILVDYQKALHDVMAKDRSLREGKGTAVETQQDPIDYSKHAYNISIIKIIKSAMQLSPQLLTIGEVDGYDVLKVMEWFIKDPG